MAAVEHPSQGELSISQVTIEDVNRILEIGQLLLSVLTSEEIEQLSDFLNAAPSESWIGNTSVT